MPHVYTSTVIDAPVAAVWAVIRDFNALPAWTPFVAESRIEANAPADQIGCVRAFRLMDGRSFAELSADFDCAPGRESELVNQI